MGKYKRKYKIGGIFAGDITSDFMWMNPDQQFAQVSRTFAMVSESDKVTSAVAVLDVKEGLIEELTESERDEVIAFSDKMTKRYRKYMYSLEHADVIIICKASSTCWYSRRLTQEGSESFKTLQGLIGHYTIIV